MSFLHLAFCCLTICSVSEGRLVQGKIGRNVSFSWTYNTAIIDATLILHNGTIFAVILPGYDYSIPEKESDRVRISIDNTVPQKVTVTVNIFNFTSNDVGLYKVIRRLNSRELDASVHLNANGATHYTKSANTHKQDTEEINQDMTTALSQKDDTEGIKRYTTATITTEVVAAAVPYKRHFLFVLLGMGTIVAAVFLTCLLRKLRICLCVDRASNSNTFNDDAKDLTRDYWTIVSNERGELRTAIATDSELISEPALIAQGIVSANIESEGNMRLYEVTMNEENDGYLNPVQSCPVKFDEHISPVHSYSVKVDEYINPVQSPVEFDEYIHPVNSSPVEFIEYITPIHSDPVSTDFVSTHHSTEF